MRTPHLTKLTLALCITATSVVRAAPQASATPTPTGGPHVIALAPLTTLGTEASASESGTVAADLTTAMTSLAGFTVVSAADVGAAIKRAKKPRLRTCDGDAVCLAELGALVGADQVVFGELGGLGDAKVVYLSLIDVATHAQLRSTTLRVDSGAAGAEGGAPGAIVRLLVPDRYQGSLAVTVDVAGAQIYINGQRLGASPLAARKLAVGTHALRVTHPEYRDFVRFVDVEFGATAAVDVGLQQFPVMTSAVGEVPGATKRNLIVREQPPRWYRTWWFVAAAGVVVATTVGIGAGVAADGINPAPDYTHPIK